MKVRIIAGLLVGGILGYLYYKMIGCYNGACLIKSDPVLMTIYGAILFALILELLHEVRSSLIRYQSKKR